MCTQGGQDIYRLLGRDPEGDPLTGIEFGVFAMLVQEISLDHDRLRAAAALAG